MSSGRSPSSLISQPVMMEFTFSFSPVQRHEFFQIELLLLLASLIISLFLSKTTPYFCVSAVCFLTTAGLSTIPIFYGGADLPDAATYTSLVFELFLFATFIKSLINDLSVATLQWHATICLTCSAHLALSALWILNTAQGSLNSNVSNVKIADTHSHV